MRSTSLQRFAEIEIILVLSCLFFLAFYHFGSDDGLTGELVTDLVARTFVFADLFSNDITSPFQGIFFVFHLSFNKGTRARGKIVFPLHHQNGCQWFQSLLSGYFSTCLSLGLVRKINILQFSSIPTSIDTFLQIGSEFALFLDSLEDSFLALGNFRKFVVPFLDFSNLDFIQSAGRFFAVTADERYGSSPVQERECIFDLSLGNVQSRCYHFIEYFHKSF